MALSILISEPNDSWAAEIKSFFQEKAYTVEEAMNGKDCQLKVYKSKYLAVVLDIDTKNHSGLEVLKYLRLNAPSVKVILTLPSHKRLDALELTKNDLKKLGASDILVKPYSFEMLLESIEGANQFESWKDIKASDSSGEEEEVEADDREFTRIKIQEFYSGNANIFDCYIRLAKNKYIKILHKGEIFDESRLKKYEKEKNLTHLYFKTKERAVYINFINQLLEKVANSKKENVVKKVQMAKNLAEKYIEEVYTEGLKPQLIDEGKKICQSMCDLVQKESHLASILASYQDYDNLGYSHLFLVSFMSTVISKHLDWSSQRTMRLIALGALLHDIGKLKLPLDIKEQDVSQLDPRQLEKYKEHPELGAKMLQRYPLISEPVRQIVFQHHEYVNGEGFPNKLTGSKIYPLAKVVALANEFANLLMKKKVTPLVGLREFITNRTNIVKFDPLIIKALVQGFVRDE